MHRYIEQDKIFIKNNILNYKLNSFLVKIKDI